MDKGSNKKILDYLIKRRNQLRKELSSFATEDKEIGQNWNANYHKRDQSATTDEKAQSVTEYERDKAIEHNLELELREVEESIEKIEEGDYGVCNNCKKKIQEGRLEAKPTASLCINCANKATLL